MNEPTLKKKGILKAQYIYNAVLLLVLLFGVSYAVVNFLYNEEGTSGSIVSSLVKITVDEDTSFSLTNASPVTDEVGLQGYSKTLTLTNTSTIDSLVNVTLNPEASNTIPATSIKYGLYINGTLKKTSSLSDTSIYDGLILQGETIKIEVYLWVDSTYTGSGTTFNGTFSVTSTEAVYTMADYVTKLVDKDKGVYKVGNDYRYSGLDADNYIWFNCKNGTTGGSNNCELWQIVGSLETKANSYANTYRRVKIVKVDNLENRTFGSNNTFASSTLHTYLNGDYYTSLTTQAQNMIIGSEWNVGSSSLTSTPAASLTSEQASKLYTKVGLLTASDIGYSTSTDNQTKALNNATLYTNSWLKGSSYYTLTPVSGNTTNVIGNNSTSIASLAVTTTTGIKPVVSLIPNVYIKGGNGTSKMPYELAIVEEEEHYSDVKVVGYITYDVNGQTVSSPKMQPIFADGSTVINRSLPDVGDAKFKGWATSQDGEVVYQIGDKVTETSDVTLYAVWQPIEFFVDTITSKLTLTDASTDIDGTRYVTGNKDTPNYVWYSGKLWRIVSINSDDTIKLVTQGNMTSIAWNTTDTNTVYENSQIHNWLKNEFLPTIEPSVLAESTWDYTTYASETSTKAEPVNYVEGEKVGLLTIYDFYKVGTGPSSFLSNGYYWWTMSPRTDGSRVWGFDDIGTAVSNGPTNSDGVRPSVNLKSDIQIVGGSGTKSNPYIIGGDKDTGVTSELLSNRISGEYINFNDVLYRIVGTEEIEGQTLTKITMADYSKSNNTIGTVAFGADYEQRIFSPTYGIGLYLEDWYQADSTSATYSTIYIKDNYKAMIATSGENGDNVVWYTGPTSPTSPSDYTLSKTGTPVLATIGLGYYGEMFSSQFGGGYNSSIDTCLMTIYSSWNVWGVYSFGTANFYSTNNSYGVRPSMYLKSNVKIVSGSGMPHDPYILTQ